MLSPLLYGTVYLIVVTILTIFISLEYNSKTNDRLGKTNTHNNITGYIISLIFALFIGFRPLSYIFTDMVNYKADYYAFAYGLPFEFTWDTENFIFDNLFSWLGANYFDVSILFLIMSILYFCVAFKAMTKLFPKDALLGFITFLGAFSTFSYATNGIKAGVATSLFLCALAYRKNLILAILFLVLSLGFHHSMILPVGAFVICLLFRNTKYYIGFWIFAVIAALLHITVFQEMFSSMADERAQSYIGKVDTYWGGTQGFRLDFVVYSVIPILIGYYAIFKKHFYSQGYNFILNLYLFTNAVWMLCMYANFTNRIAYLSWFLYPVVLIYPFLEKEFVNNQYQKLNYVVWFQLLFTLVMHFFYYG